MTALDPVALDRLTEDAITAARRFTPRVPDAQGRLTWWQLSFTDADGWFLGGALVEGPSLAVALARSHLLGCNPGGAPTAFGFRATWVHPHWVERHLTARDVRFMPGPEGFQGPLPPTMTAAAPTAPVPGGSSAGPAPHPGL